MLGIYRLSARIYDLRRLGYQIETEKTNFGKTKHTKYIYREAA